MAKRTNKNQGVEDKDFQDFQHLQPRYRLLREMFVQEYLKDFNATQAVLRMGYKYNAKVANRKGAAFMGDAYTQWYLYQMQQKIDERTVISRTEVLLGLKREANNMKFNTGSERISALRTMAKILGMEITKIEGNMTLNGGVMVIPLSGSPDEWSKSAAEAQKVLKQTVRV